ncbi:hypothetical protein ANT2_2776 [plant metagenome]|uniref:Uncharacterized protein n=1 Tax=plant metagenome TaxID=1297885 RepID=A0A484RKZ2_9ZZZZ
MSPWGQARGLRKKPRTAPASIATESRLATRNARPLGFSGRCNDNFATLLHRNIINSGHSARGHQRRR